MNVVAQVSRSASLRPLRPSVSIAALLLAGLAGFAVAEEITPAQRAKDALIVKTLLRLRHAQKQSGGDMDYLGELGGAS